MDTTMLWFWGVVIYFVSGLAVATIRILILASEERVLDSDVGFVIMLFWPIYLVYLLGSGAYNLLNEAGMDREREPLNSAPGRVIHDWCQRKAPPGDPDSWGSE